jgi:large conductance mechanosensitive channel
MWREFKAFLIKQNVIALAVAFVVGVATNDLVKAVVDDFIMPIVTAALPDGAEWREWKFPNFGPVRFTVGHFLSVLLNFTIVVFVAWQITRNIIRPAPDAKPSTRPCPYCKQSIDAAATRCAYCTSQLTAAG